MSILKNRIKYRDLILLIVAFIPYSCSPPLEVRDVPNIFVGEFCKTDILNGNKYKLKISNDMVIEGTKEKSDEWELKESKIIKNVSKDWNRLTIYAKNNSGDYFRYTLKIEDGNLITYSGFLLDKSNDDNIEDLQWDDSKVGSLSKCN